MKITLLNNVINSLDEKPIQIGERACQFCGRPTDEKPLTVRIACTEALGSAYQDEVRDRPISGEEKMKRYRLAIKVQDAENEIELDAKQITTILELISKRFPSPVVYGRLYDILNGKEKSSEPNSDSD